MEIILVFLDSDALGCRATELRNTKEACPPWHASLIKNTMYLQKTLEYTHDEKVSKKKFSNNRLPYLR